MIYNNSNSNLCLGVETGWGWGLGGSLGFVDCWGFTELKKSTTKNYGLRLSSLSLMATYTGQQEELAG